MLNPWQQMALQHSMIGQVNSAVSDEMASRVAQAREQRRQQHERAMQEDQLRALIVRLQHERAMFERAAEEKRISEDKGRGVIASSSWYRNPFAPR